MGIKTNQDAAQWLLNLCKQQSVEEYGSDPSQSDNTQSVLNNQNYLNIKLAQKKLTVQQAQSMFKVLIQKLIANRLKQDEFIQQLKQNFDMSPHRAFSTIKNDQGYTFVQVALLNNNFATAKTLINFGAPFNQGERECLEISFASQTPVTRHFSPTDVNPRAQSQQLHTMKEFGLTLGINATGKDGTLSQFAHVGPTYHMMQETISQYSTQLDSNDRDKNHFQDIQEAFSFSDEACNFQFSRPSDDAGDKLAQRIQEGKLTSVPTSCAGHVMAMSIVPNEEGGAYLVFTNRGLGAQEFGTQIYNVDDINKLDANFLQTMVSGHNNGTPHDDIMERIKSVVNPKEPVQTIEQKGQKNDNCTIANPRANLEGVLLCQKAIQKKRNISELGADFKASVKGSYKSFTLNMRERKLKDLTQRLSQDPHNDDLKTLAREYLKQHPNRSEPQLQALVAASTNEPGSLFPQPPKPFTSNFDSQKVNQKVNQATVADPNPNLGAGSKRKP